MKGLQQKSGLNGEKGGWRGEEEKMTGYERIKVAFHLLSLQIMHFLLISDKTSEEQTFIFCAIISATHNQKLLQNDIALTFQSTLWKQKALKALNGTNR